MGNPPKIARPKQFLMVELPDLEHADGTAAIAKVRRLTQLEVGEIRGAVAGHAPRETGESFSAADLERAKEIGDRWFFAALVEPKVTRAAEPEGDAIPYDWFGEADKGAVVEAAMALVGIHPNRSFRDGHRGGLAVRGTA